MKTLPLFLASLLYIWQAIFFFISDQPAMGFVFLGYALANFGLMAVA